MLQLKPIQHRGDLCKLQIKPNVTTNFFHIRYNNSSIRLFFIIIKTFAIKIKSSVLYIAYERLLD
jgi:hypothetical protein